MALVGACEIYERLALPSITEHRLPGPSGPKSAKLGSPVAPLGPNMNWQLRNVRSVMPIYKALNNQDLDAVLGPIGSERATTGSVARLSI
jgi:hypothetical protein